MPRPAATPFVGRAEEFEALLTWVAEPGTAAVLLLGDEGMGKTRLVQAFAAQRAATGAGPVVIGRCGALADEALPFVALAEILHQLIVSRPGSASDGGSPEVRGMLSYLVPELGRPPPGAPQLHTAAGKLRLFAAVRDVLSRAVPGTIIAIEDAHWMTASGIELLDFLLRSPPDGVRYIVTARDPHGNPDHPLTRFVNEARRARLLDVLSLGPLSPEDVQHMVAAVIGHAASAADVDRIFELSAGNPFIAEELARAWLTGDGQQIPRHLTDLLAQPVHELTADAQAVVHAAAVAGTAVEHALLVRVVGMEPSDVEKAVTEAFGARLLEATEGGRGYRFRQELVRQAVYGQVLPGERERLHRAYAAALADAAERPGGAELAALTALARHCDEAGDTGRALRWTLAAATAAEDACVFREALALYLHALELSPSTARSPVPWDNSRLDVLRRAARMADVVADHAAGLRLVDAALALIDAAADPVSAALLQERRAWYRAVTGAVPAPTDCRTAVELLPVAPATPERARVLATHGRLLAMAGRPEAAKGAAEEALAVAVSLGAPHEQVGAWISLGAARIALGDFAAGEQALRAACELARQADDVEHLASAHALLLNIRLLRDPDRTAVAEFALASYDLVRRIGVAESFLALGVAVAKLELGQWDAADDHAQMAVNDDGHAATSALLLLTLLTARRGGRVGTLDTAPSAVHPAELRAPAVLRRAEWLTECQLLQQQPDAAAATVWTALTQVQGNWLRAFVGRLLSLGMRAHADRVAAGLDRRDEDVVADARAAAEALRERAARLHPDPLDAFAVLSPTAAAESAAWEAERSRLTGASDPDRWGAAADQWKAASRPYETAWAKWRQAEALLASRPRRRDVVPVIRDAREIARQLGARPLQHRLDALARHAHLAAFVAESSEAAAPAVGRPPSLTPREIDVLRLVADGLPNRAIARSLVLSPKTVETHMAHVLVKLDVHDRVSAVTRAQRLGLIG